MVALWGEGLPKPKSLARLTLGSALITMDFRFQEVDFSSLKFQNKTCKLQFRITFFFWGGT
jgi:hypothetical protein